MVNQLPGAGPLLPQENDEFNTWWNQSGKTETRRQARCYLRDRTDDVEDVVQTVYVKLAKVYYSDDRTLGKTLNDIQRMRPTVARNVCIDVIRGMSRVEPGTPINEAGESLIDLQPDERPSANQEQLLTDADYYRYIEQCLDRGVADRDLSPTEVAIWKEVRLKGKSPKEMQVKFSLTAVEVARRLKRVDLYVYQRFNARMLTLEMFSPAWVRNRTNLTKAVDAAARHARNLAGAQPPLQATTIANYVALTLRTVGRLTIYLYKGGSEAEISSVLREMCLDSRWFHAPFADSPAVTQDIKKAQALDDQTAGQHDDPEKANVTQAQAIKLRQKVVEKLVSDIVPWNGANGND